MGSWRAVDFRWDRTLRAGLQFAPSSEKGLRVQLAEQEEMLKGLQLEQQYLHSPLTYTTLQTAQLRRRQAELAARLDELTKAAAAVGKK